MPDEVLYEADGPIATLILNRPDKMNAFNGELFAALRQALDRAEHDPAIRVVIIKGAGRAFSVGMDLEGGPSPAQLGVTADRSRLQHHIEDFLHVWDFPKPVIGQVHGFCIAAGTMLALACDITLVSTDCRIRFPSIPIGGGFVSSFWTFFVGPKRAKEMDFIAGNEISGADAEVWGFANRAIPPAELAAKATHMAKAISKTPPDLLRLKKMAINRVVEWQGFRQAMIGGAEWDTLCHFSEGASEMRQRVVELGMKEAIKSLQA
jgi:enoyl-CoA hydratase